MIVSIHQPAYLPWLGYFHKILLSDTFVFFDTPQFEKNSFINRNKIKTPMGEQWLSAPIKLKNHLAKEINQIELADQTWQQQHAKAIELNYKKAKYFNDYWPKLQTLYQKKYSHISEVCYDQLVLFNGLLGIETKIVKSSDLPKYESKKQDLVLDICKDLEADIYVSGSQGKDYINKEKFEDNNIKLYFQDYHHPTYDQLWGEFMPAMGIADLLFNLGPKSKEIILKNNITKQDLYE